MRNRDLRTRPELPFAHGPLPPALRRRRVTIAAGQTLNYDPQQWTGALVVLDEGDIVLEDRRGRDWPLGCGAVLWLAGLPLRRLRNAGAARAVLVAVVRRGHQHDALDDSHNQANAA